MKKLKKKKIAVIDIEVGPNYLIVGCMNFKTGKVWQFRENQRKEFLKWSRNYNAVMTFNGIRYDGPVIGAWLNGNDPYEVSKALIEEGANWWDFPKAFPAAHIDLMNVSPAVEGGLKLQGGRIFAKKLQDLPVDPHAKLGKKEIKALADYNINDLELTRQLGEHLWPQIELRQQIGERYGLNLLGKSEPQIAEAIFEKELGINRREVKQSVPKSVTYHAPKYMKFKSKKLQKLLEQIDGMEIKINQVNGQPIMPELLKDRLIIIGNTGYQMGLGGVHAHVKQLVVEDNIEDADVASMYASIILANNYYIPQLGRKWLDKYREIHQTRQKAKEVLANA
jgi:hypothetical protein